MSRCNIKLWLIVLVYFQTLTPEVLSISQVLQQYQQALKLLISARQQTFPNSTQSLLSNALILSTYQKLINPSVLQMNGYAQLVSSELARKFPFYKDLDSLDATYKTYKKEIAKIVTLFAQQSDQLDAWNVFHESL